MPASLCAGGLLAHKPSRSGRAINRRLAHQAARFAWAAAGQGPVRRASAGAMLEAPGPRAEAAWPHPIREEVMTWSIIVHEPATGWFGIGIATRFFAVGALCPLAAAGIGAVCSQAMPNPALRQRALALLGE